MNNGKAKGYRVAVKDDAGSAWHQGPFPTIERAERELHRMLDAFKIPPRRRRAVAWKIYPVYQGRTVPWQPVTSTAGT